MGIQLEAIQKREICRTVLNGQKVWIELILSPASSAVFEEMLDNEEDYQSTVLTKLEK